MRRCRLRILYVLVGAMCLSMTGCQESTVGEEEEISGLISLEGMALRVADSHASDTLNDGAQEAPDEDAAAAGLPDSASRDAEADAQPTSEADTHEADAHAMSPDQGPPSSGVMSFDGVPEENVPARVVREEHHQWCTTDSADAEPAPDASAAQRAAPPAYRPVLFATPREAPPRPSNLRGGRVLTLRPDPEMGSLFEDFRALGCEQEAHAASLSCIDHPYALALARELADPTEALDALRAQYALAYQQELTTPTLSGEDVVPSPAD
jgi:hypothetical protein